MTQERLQIIVGTDSGLGLLGGSPADGWQWTPVHTTRRVQEIYPQPSAAGGVFYAGTRGDGAWVTRDAGETWQRVEGIPEAIVRSFAAVDRQLLVGTEPARLFHREADGDWQEAESFLSVPGAGDWFTPYSQHAGATRTLTVDPHEPGRVLAGIEVGGLLDSRDGGRRWTRIGEGIHQDVHHLEPDPHIPGRLFAATAGGVYRSRDGGASWEHISSGMDGQYTRAVTVHPQEKDVLLTAVSPRVGGLVRLYVSGDAGSSWDEVAYHLPGRLAFINRFSWGPDGAVYAVTTGGTLVRGTAELDDGWQRWELSLEDAVWGGEVVQT